MVVSSILYKGQLLLHILAHYIMIFVIRWLSYHIFLSGRIIILLSGIINHAWLLPKCKEVLGVDIIWSIILKIQRWQGRKTSAS